jgi:transposase InsO family protein/transposase
MSIILGLFHLDPQSRSRAIDELAGRELTVPYSNKKTLTRATIYRWLKEYRSTIDPGAALLQKPRRDRGTFRKLTEPQQNALLRWRYDNLYRTAEDLRQELLTHAATGQDPVPCENTIARFLRSAGLDRKTLIFERKAEETGRPQKTTRLAFEAPYPQHIWQADTKGPKLMVQDPQNPEQLLEAKLIICMDDHSRYVTGARYFLEETEQQVMAVFRSAIATYGVPDILYCDLGSPYIGHSLLKAAALVGCHVLHTPRADAPAKGKIEKQMQPFNEKLESELALLPAPPSLDEANEYLAAFISQHYHARVHSSTSERPIDRYASFPAEYRRFVSERTLALIFLPCATSKVSKTCLIRLHNIQYLVPDPRLSGQKVDVRYDPLDPGRALIFFKDEFRGEACVHNNTSDFLSRQAELSRMENALRSAIRSDIPPAEAVPYYSFLERRLAAYRLEKESFSEINTELAALREKKAMVKATLADRPSGAQGGNASPVFGHQELAHLLAVLLKRRLASDERLKVAVLWEHYGPLNEALVRTTVGRLLGEGRSEVSACLDAIRIATCSKSSKEDKKDER